MNFNIILLIITITYLHIFFFNVKISAKSDDVEADYSYAANIFQQTYDIDLQVAAESPSYTFNMKYDVSNLDPITGFTDVAKLIHMTLTFYSS